MPTVQGAACWCNEMDIFLADLVREQMVSAATRPQHSRAPLECSGTGEGHHGRAVDKS